jgi:hypothetical protein
VLRIYLQVVLQFEKSRFVMLYSQNQDQKACVNTKMLKKLLGQVSLHASHNSLHRFFHKILCPAYGKRFKEALDELLDHFDMSSQPKSDPKSLPQNNQGKRKSRNEDETKIEALEMPAPKRPCTNQENQNGNQPSVFTREKLDSKPRLQYKKSALGHQTSLKKNIVLKKDIKPVAHENKQPKKTNDLKILAFSSPHPTQKRKSSKGAMFGHPGFAETP